MALHDYATSAVSVATVYVFKGYHYTFELQRSRRNRNGGKLAVGVLCFTRDTSAIAMDPLLAIAFIEESFVQNFNDTLATQRTGL